MKSELFKHTDHWCEGRVFFSTHRKKGVGCSINVYIGLCIFKLVNELPSIRGKSSGCFRAKRQSKICGLTHTYPFLDMCLSGPQTHEGLLWNRFYWPLSNGPGYRMSRKPDDDNRRW